VCSKAEPLFFDRKRESFPPELEEAIVRGFTCGPLGRVWFLVLCGAQPLVRRSSFCGESDFDSSTRMGGGATMHLFFIA
jgi:hypothetical protein